MASILETWVFLFALVVLVTHFADKWRLAAPLLLVPVGLVVSLIPKAPLIALNPGLVLDVFLPLLIYASAITVPWHQLKQNARPIAMLSVGLVVVTALGVGLLANTIIPGLGLGMAFILGAIISPPDDVAIAALTRYLPLPGRLEAILEGEGLFNDATALTLFHMALIIAIGGRLSLWQVPVFFASVVIGESLYGFAVGMVALAVRRYLNNPELEITVSLITPFVAFLPTETLGGSGILATLIAGLVLNLNASRFVPPATRIDVLTFWRIVGFWLNNLLFLILGLQLKFLLMARYEMPLRHILYYGLLVSLAVIAIRFAYVFPASFLSRRLSGIRQMPTTRHLVAVAAAGMRGAISLAAALALPLTQADGKAFKGRDLVVLITYVVILVTLVLQGLILKPLLRRLGLIRAGLLERKEAGHAELVTRLEVTAAGIAALKAMLADPAVPQVLVRSLLEEREYYYRQIERHLNGEVNPTERRLAVKNVDVHRAELSAERDRLLNLANSGRISDDVLRKIERDLDLREQRLAAHEFAQVRLLPAEQ